MSTYGMKIAGVGAYAPPRVVTNDEIDQELRRIGEPFWTAKLGRSPTHKESRAYRTNDEWIRKGIGFIERRFGEPGQGTIDLAIPAARLAMQAAKVEPEEIDAIYFATVTPSYLNSPPDAALLQAALGIPAFTEGLPREMIGVDSSLACSSWLAAFRQAYQAIRCGDVSTALVVGADAMDTTINWLDRTFACVLGVGAGVAVVQGVDRTEDWSQPNWGWSWLDGTKADVIITPEGGSRHPIQSAESLAEYRNRLTMDGKKVREEIVPFIGGPAIDAALAKAGLTLNHLDFAIFHEANLVLNADIEASWRARGFRGEVFNASGLFGNTTSAAVPLSLALALEAGKIKPGQLGALVVFGGGYSTVIVFVRVGEAIPALLDV